MFVQLFSKVFLQQIKLVLKDIKKCSRLTIAINAEVIARHTSDNQM